MATWSTARAGRCPSRSGNVVAPGEVIEKFGAEILRLWVASEDYRDDVKVSDEILRQVADAYRKIRNTIRYMLGNLTDFDPDRHRLARRQLPELDRWALARYDELAARIVKAFERFEFHAVYQGLNYFCGTTMSAFYLDIIKDRLYASGSDSLPRRAAQTALYEILHGMLRLMSPILSFTAAEAGSPCTVSTDRSSLTAGIFFAEFPVVNPEPVDQGMEQRWLQLIRLRAEITKALEIARRDKIIGHPLEAEVQLQVAGEMAEFITQEWRTIREIAIVSALCLKDDLGDDVFRSEEIEGLAIKVVQAPGQKCERCWTRSTTVGDDLHHPLICDRCAAVVGSLDTNREGQA